MSRSLIGDFRGSLRSPEFWVYSTWLEIITKYRRSRLGILWAFVPPAIYTFGIGWFFSFMQPGMGAGFYAHMAVGYVIYRFSTVVLNDATTTCSAHAAFIMDGRVRLTDYVLRVVSRALFHFVIALPVVAIALCMHGDVSIVGLVVGALGFGVVLVNVAWVGAVVSIVGARINDVHLLMGSVLMFSFLLTPILWQADFVPPNTVQGFLARFNPLFHFVEIVRAPILGKSVETATIVYLALMTAIGWSASSIIYRRYAKFVPVWI